jgi:tetratricopeptide (TPR) repeat protein
MAINVNSLWDYSKPDVSEERFRAALEGASEDDRLILRTQIARTYGLRRDFVKAREGLAAVETALSRASAEVQVRYFLELGRTYCSPVHSQELRTPENVERARASFLHAYELAASARLDYLAVDALHMMPVVDAEPDRQLEWNEKALAYLERSDQPEVKGWEASLRNNVGHAMRLKGEYEAALSQFRLSREAHERAGRAHNVRIADWMIARTYRDQKRFGEAIAIQLDLERAWDVEGGPDPYVFEELEQLYRSVGDETRAQHYGERLKATRR